MERFSLEVKPTKIESGKVQYSRIENGIVINSIYDGEHAKPENLERTNILETLMRFNGVSGACLDGQWKIFVG